MYVGGVGGVGGLTNMWDPRLCDSPAGRAGAYCFHNGVLSGLTPFALLVVLAWTLPFALSAFVAGLRVSRCQSGITSLNTNVGAALVVSDDCERELASGFRRRHLFRMVWGASTCMWFLIPAAQYLTSPYYQKDVWHGVLALAIAAAFPLSWHLSLVALPMTTCVAPLLAWSRADITSCHKVIGYSTMFWAILHGTGELVYLASQRRLYVFNAFKSGENLLYLLGALTLSIFVLHFAIAILRRRMSKEWFRCLHQIFASLLLLAASAHWWPFVFFLIPVTAMHAAAAAVAHQSHTTVDLQCFALALAMAVVVGVGVVFAVWALRQTQMQQPHADLYTPFVYPPLTMLLSFIAAYIVVRGFICYRSSRSSGLA